MQKCDSNKIKEEFYRGDQHRVISARFDRQCVVHRRFRKKFINILIVVNVQRHIHANVQNLPKNIREQQQQCVFVQKQIKEKTKNTHSQRECRERRRR